MKRWIIGVLTLLILAGGGALYSYATVTANSIVTAQTPTLGKTNFIQGTDVALTYKTVYTAGANGSKCNGISVANTDSTATHLVSFEITNGGNTYLTSSFTTVSPSVGAVGTADALAGTNWSGLATDSDGNKYLQMVSGDVLKATFASAFTGSLTPLAQITILAECSDF